ncbi:MAG: hypothetical protein ABI880_08405 [Acidobacteriota bacterium]
MTDGGIGRILVASLHQSIGDTLPARLDYYEHWLTPMGLRDSRAGRAPLGAVLSFLRQEGQEAYDRVMDGAGHCSADWYFAPGGVTPRLLRVLPRSLRARLALRRSRRLLRTAFAPATVTVTTRRGAGTVAISGAIFCQLREAWPWPTCRYYAAAVERHMELHGVPADVTIEACQSSGSSGCRLEVTFRRHGADGPKEPA